MIGFSPRPFDAPPFPTSTHPSTNQNKRLASSREELESSWHSSSPFSTSARAQVLHTISCNSTSSDDLNIEINDRSFKRQRTNDSIDTSNRQKFVSAVRISPDNRPPKPVYFMSDDTIKAGWYTGTVNYIGQRSGHGLTKHDDGTEYDGEYLNDVMHGWGKYKFTTMKQLVNLNGRTMHRVTERVFEGSFDNGKSEGKGRMITTVIDTESKMNGVYVKVVYDCGYYRGDGEAVGEGTRFTFTRSSVCNEWKEVCTRLSCGECTGMVTSREYGEWVCDCLGLDGLYPEVPSL
ncbi:hypothetical protein ACHAXN_009559 [Cyclotella atomus]